MPTTPKTRPPYRAAERTSLAALGYVPASAAAAKIGKSTQTIYYWIAQKKIEGVRIGVHWYVRERSIIDYYKLMDPKAVELLGLR